MKNACVFHCYGSKPNHFWYPYVKRELQKNGYEVWLPELPNINDPDLELQLPYILNNYKYNKDTVIISHSSSVPLTLALLEEIEIKIKLAILVSGFVDNLPNCPRKILKDQYNWEKIKNNCEKFVFINSVNDPWGCDDKQGRKMFDKLGGELIIRNEGHMGSDSFNQPYKEFPLLINLVKTFG